MLDYTKLPPQLFSPNRRINLYFLHHLFKILTNMVSQRLHREFEREFPLTAGMWGGSYLIADEEGRARTNVVRLYSIINLPQGTPLDKAENFEFLMRTYSEIYQKAFEQYGLRFVDPHWGEPIPYTNRERPTTTLQMWDQSGRVKFVRAFFVWNTATWEESIIYDSIRNIKQIKELLDLDRRPMKKTPEELKFLLQDVLIIYFTLRPALTPDFVEHAEPIVTELLKQFLAGLHDEALIEEWFYRVYKNALVYGYEEALEEPYAKYNLDIKKIETWPVDKINWVPEELKAILGPYLKNPFHTFQTNLEKNNLLPPGWKTP